MEKWGHPLVELYLYRLLSKLYQLSAFAIYILKKNQPFELAQLGSYKELFNSLKSSLSLKRHF